MNRFESYFDAFYAYFTTETDQLGQFENLGFVIMSTRENIRPIARAPLSPWPSPLKQGRTRVIFYVRRIGLYLYKYRIYGTITIYILKGLAFVYQLVFLHH